MNGLQRPFPIHGLRVSKNTNLGNWLLDKPTIINDNVVALVVIAFSQYEQTLCDYSH